MKKVKTLMGFVTFTLPSLELLLFQIPIFSNLALVMVLIQLQGFCIVPKQEKKKSVLEKSALCGPQKQGWRNGRVP